MPFITKLVRPDDIVDLLTQALDEYDASERCRKLGWTALQYFQHVDERAGQLGQVVTYLAVCGAEEHDVPLGFARFTLEDTLPGYQSLPGDNSAICLDEVFVHRAFRGRGIFPVLIGAVRTVAMEEGAAYVYARVVNRGFSSALQRYGLGPLPLLVGTLNQLRLPEAKEAADDTGSWATRATRWHHYYHGADVGKNVGKGMRSEREVFDFKRKSDW